jgi:uncharacterized protein (TIGR02569 family)
MNSRIPFKVLDLFGVKGDADPLPGGQGAAIRYEDIVIKPCDNPVEWIGLAPLLSMLPQIGYRVAKPVQALNNRWVVDGWMATHFVEGKPGFSGREEEAIAACRRFHQELSQVYGSSICPKWLIAVPTVWRKADRIAWGELPLPSEFDGDICRLLKPIADLRNIIDLPNQITHGDPGGSNILYAENLAPAIIDISPYWRPAGYAIAMMLADGIAWEGSEVSILARVHEEPNIGQLLLRAVLFRLTISALVGGPVSFSKNFSVYEVVTQWAMDHID